MNRRQNNNQWSDGIAVHPAPKNSECNMRWKISCLDFFGSRWRPPYRLSPKGPNYQRGVLLISAGEIERHFEGKTPREGHSGGLVLARQCTAHRALATQKKLTYLGFQCLDHPPYSLTPSDTTSVL